MKLFLDSASADQWHAPPGCPPIQGVTTNPSLIRQAGLPINLETYLHLIEQAGERKLADLMLQLPRNDVDEAREWLSHLVPAGAQASLRLTIKLPCRADWLPVLREVQGWSLQTLLTGLSNPMQLLWAHAQGANYVAPYLGRLEAGGRDIWPLVEACVAMQQQGVKLLAASVKKPDTLSRLIAAGAYSATVRPAFARELANDPLTDAAIEEFNADVALSLKSRIE